MSKQQNHPSIGRGVNSLPALERRLGPIAYRPIGMLTAFQNNPRKHPEKQIAKLAASIAEFGFAMPVLVDSHGSIIAGEARVIAAARLGIAELPVIVAEAWSAAQVRAYRLADNRLAELARWDDAMLAIELAAIIEIDETPIEILGWDGIDLPTGADLVQPEDSASNPDKIPIELPGTAVTRTGDLWLLGEHRLLCGSPLDPFAWTRLLGEERASLAFIDPLSAFRLPSPLTAAPDFRGEEVAVTFAQLDTEDFARFLLSLVTSILPHLQEGAILELCADWRRAAQALQVLAATPLVPVDLCVWNKRSAEPGSFYPAQHELVVIAQNGDRPGPHQPAFHKRLARRSNVWTYPAAKNVTAKQAGQLLELSGLKPVALVADAICDVTHKGEIVLDPCVGPGTIFLAAQQCRRRAFGIEAVPEYVDLTVRRWQEVSGQPATLAGTARTFADLEDERSKPVDRSLLTFTAANGSADQGGSDRAKAKSGEVP